MQDELTKIIVAMTVFAAATLCILFLNSCATVHPTVVEHVRHDSVFIERLRVDSAYVHDSIYIRERSDTVWVTRWHTDWRYQYIHDTTAVTRVDSIPYEVTVTQVVTQNSAHARFCIWAFWLLVLAAFIYFAARIILKLYFRNF